MNKFHSRTAWRRWTAGAAAALAATAAVSAFAVGGPGSHGGGAMQGGPGAEAPLGRHGGHGGRGAHGGGLRIERMLDAAQATTEQRIKIRQIMVAAEEELRAQRQSRTDGRGAMMALLAQPKIDTAAVEKLRAQGIADHDAASRRMTQAMVEAANVLKPEQRKALAEHMAQRHERRAMMRGEGQGPGAGPERQPGRADDAATK